MFSSCLMSNRYSVVVCYLLFFMLHFSHAQQSKAPSRPPKVKMICKPFGSCEPCPDSVLRQPFCQPFGNRRLVHCVPDRSNISKSQDSVSEVPSQGETPAWQSCGRIPSKERSDFVEFVLCNILFASVALGLLLLRSRRLEAMQARQLAARIGFVRGPGGVLV